MLTIFILFCSYVAQSQFIKIETYWKLSEEHSLHIYQYFKLLFVAFSNNHIKYDVGAELVKLL